MSTFSEHSRPKRICEQFKVFLASGLHVCTSSSSSVSIHVLAIALCCGHSLLRQGTFTSIWCSVPAFWAQVHPGRQSLLHENCSMRNAGYTHRVQFGRGLCIKLCILHEPQMHGVINRNVVMPLNCWQHKETAHNSSKALSQMRWV